MSDLISRQAAIDAIRGAYFILNRHVKSIDIFTLG